MPVRASPLGRIRAQLSVVLLVGTLSFSAQTGSQSTAQAESESVIALDPGHSSWDVGATGSGLREYQLTLDVARRTRALLEADGIAVRLTRDDDNRVAPQVPSDPTEAVRVEQEARLRAAGDPTLYVSIHFNGHPNSGLRGTETYYNPDNLPSDAFLLASALQRETRAALASAGYISTDRGVSSDLSAGKPYGHFFSLRGSFPSALVEVLFLTNPNEAAVLYDDEIRDAIARGIATGIESYLASAASS